MTIEDSVRRWNELVETGTPDEIEAFRSQFLDALTTKIMNDIPNADKVGWTNKEPEWP